MIDVYPRMIVGAHVHNTGTAALAVALTTDQTNDQHRPKLRVKPANVECNLNIDRGRA